MKIRIVIFIFLLQSCSSLKKTFIYTSASGVLAGATSGVLLSPNKEVRLVNGVVFGLAGAAVAGSVGWLLYKDDPRNFKLKNMLTGSEQREFIELDLGQMKINMSIDKEEAYKIPPIRNLPSKLKGKVGRQFVIKYTSKERYLKKNNKTFYIPSFSIYEHSYNLPGQIEKP